MANTNLKLVGGWFSPFVLRVKIALKIKSLEYESVEETLNPKSQLLLQSNPVHKKIPVLLHGDKPICESRIILEYIDEVWKSGPSILPADAYDRAMARFWAAYIEEKVLIRWNMQHQPGVRKFSQWPWLRVFGSLCWLIWKNRCNKVFEGTSDLPHQLLHRGLHFLHEGVEEGRFKHKIFRVPERYSEGWSAPPEGYVRIDVDAAVDNHRNSAVGEVVRDNSGAWICGFQQNTGFSLGSTASEIQAIRIGLQICKSGKFRRIKLFTDSLQAIQLLFNTGSQYHPLQYELEAVRELIYRDWDLEMHHCHREALKCADLLTKRALDLNSDLSILQYPPDFCTPYMSADLS